MFPVGSEREEDEVEGEVEEYALLAVPEVSVATFRSIDGRVVDSDNSSKIIFRELEVYIYIVQGVFN